MACQELVHFICLFLTALGLRWGMWAFSSCGEREGLSNCGVGLLIALASLTAEVASLIARLAPECAGFSSCRIGLSSCEE